MRRGSSRLLGVSDPTQPRGTFDPIGIVHALDRHGVRYVLVGGVAARLHGSPALTEDFDLSPERSHENLANLAAALAELDARLAAPGVAEGLVVPLDAHTFNSPVMTFATCAGDVDVVLETLVSGGYDELSRRSVAVEVFGVRLAVASLEDIIASKEAANRPKDRAHLEILWQLRDELGDRPDQRD